MVLPLLSPDDEDDEDDEEKRKLLHCADSEVGGRDCMRGRRRSERAGRVRVVMLVLILDSPVCAGR